LWRFWRRLPRDGRIVVFDRSWYGRALVERVEAFATEDEWKRSYDEIREFERWLVGHGVTLLKFWLEVSPDEQAKRFEARGTVPFKKYKLTPDDFRNRAKRPAYAEAANEMFARTDAKGAKWHVLRADDKKAVRLEVLCRVAAAMEAAADAD
jgi:AMP-polyphosphate phosphotransferase